ncbi:MAG: PucR family transcriptional regulator [Hungatella hathewayi]|nr:PucR family transcriptional regulator [Hungatella hathewayi]
MTKRINKLYDTDKYTKEEGGRGMPYTLREMMRTGPFQELQVIAGKEGLDNPIRYVGVLEAPDSVDFVKEYEFVLTTGYVFSNQTERMMEMIRKLHEHGAAALGIKMFRYVQTIPEEAKKLADEYRFPIFFIPNKYSWHELILPMILNISATGSEEGVFYQDYDQLIYGMQHSQTIYDFISRAGELLQKPLLLLNRMTGDMLQYPSDYQLPVREAGQWLKLLADGQGRLLQNGKVRYCRPRAAVADESADGGGRERERGFLADSLTGFLAMELQMPEYQYLILWDSPEPGNINQFNYLVYSLMLVSESMQNRRRMQKNLILQKGLDLQGIFLENRPEESRMEAMGVAFGETSAWTPALVRFAGKDGRMEERISIYNPVVVRLLEQLSQKRGIHGFTDKEGRLHLLILLGDNTWKARELLAASRKICAGVMKTVQGYFPDLTVQMTVGRWGSGWEGVKIRHEELCHTVESGKSQSVEAGLLHIHDMGMGVFLANPQVRTYLDEFLEEYFEPLEELGPEVREHVVEAVDTYIRAGFNTREAARLLDVHHNTVRNRLEQFVTLTGLDLKQSEDLLMLLIYLQNR